MKCSKCGNEVNNFPEHLAGLADVVCQKCTGAPPAPSDLESMMERYNRGISAIATKMNPERTAA